jgi:Uma2 family endonuclease
MNSSATETHALETRSALPPVQASYAEYLTWEHSGSLVEWVNGEIIIHMPPKEYHQRVVVFLTTLLQSYVRLYRLGRVIAAPFTMRAMPGGDAREPDLFFLATANLTRLSENELNGPADLVIEVISDDSVVRDRDEKFHEYQQGGVREYWIIDPRPQRLRADFYVLDAQGRYQPVPIPDNRYQAAVLPEFWLNVEWLWAVDPDPLAALAAIVGIEQMVQALRSPEA